MSKLIALRIPDNMAAKLDSRCSIRHQGKTEVLLEAIARGWDEDEYSAYPDPELPHPGPSLEERKAVAVGALSIYKDAEAEPEGQRMCSYKEYDTESGEWYGCTLAEHSPKIKHRRGPIMRSEQ